MHKFSKLLVTARLCFILTACNLPIARVDESTDLVYQPPVDLAAEDRDRVMPIDKRPGIQTSQPLCSSDPTSFVTDLAVYHYPNLELPEAGIYFSDPVFGTCLVRVTDQAQDLHDEDPSKGMKNEYSRVQSFNADGTLIIVRSIEAFWYLYDAQTLQPLRQLPLTEEPRWDAKNPNRVYTIDGTRLFAYDLAQNEIQLVHDFQLDYPDLELEMVWTRYEGSPDKEGRFWGLMAQDQDWQVAAFLVYDMEIDQVIASRLTPENPEVDSVTISPSGQYFLAYFDTYCEDGQTGSDSSPCGLMVYDQQLEHGRSVLPIIGHSDTALDAAGRDVLVYQDIRADTIAVLDLESGIPTALFPIDFSHSPLGFHFSGRALDRPGWILVSTYSGAYPLAKTWMDNQVFALELEAGGQVVRLAHTHSVVDEDQEHDYWAEPHATVNQNFSRILFTSNWGRSGSESVEMFLVELPSNWIENLP